MKYPETEDEIEDLATVDLSGEATTCRTRFREPDEDWMYDSA